MSKRPIGGISYVDGKPVVRWSVADDSRPDGRRQVSKQFEEIADAEAFLARLRGEKPKLNLPFWMNSYKEWVEQLLAEVFQLREQLRRMKIELENEKSRQLHEAVLLYLGETVEPITPSVRRDPVLGARENAKKKSAIVEMLAEAARTGECGGWVQSGSLRSEVGLPKSTYKAIMDKLLADGVVEYHRDSKRYRITESTHSERRAAA